jgi:hypothetical protein
MEKSIRPTTRRKMHQTTVRFGEDLWRALEVEAKQLGVSIAQYVRDAALGRLSYDAGRRDEQQTGTGEPRARAAEIGADAAQQRAQSELSQSEAYRRRPGWPGGVRPTSAPAPTPAGRSSAI